MGCSIWTLCPSEVLGRGREGLPMYLISSLPSPDEGATHLSPSSGSVFLRKAMVKKADLELVAGNDTWRVNNKYDRSRTPFPMEEIIRRSEPWIGKELAYRLFLKNCEHFVTMLRYGDGVSEQVSARGIAGLVAAAGIPAFGFPLLASCAVSGGGSLASIGLTSSNIVHYVSFAKFAKAGRDILEKSCC
uniref:Uncharacterized protein n=1 Tax=Geospiza parvula TaxID=87175 RepID=A0A8C3MNC1_GEOPR